MATSNITLSNASKYRYGAEMSMEFAAVINYAESLFQSAGNYSKFEGSTMVGKEGLIIGYKHHPNKVAYAICITATSDAGILAMRRVPDGVWTVRRIFSGGV